MIVKDEEDMLPRCLESIKCAVDDIIVVDTGSSDRTVEIAKHYGARVYHHAWEKDFSKHRNQSISYARSEWILIMDADEELFAEDAKLLKEVIGRSKADYIYLQCHDMEKTGKPHGVFNQVRLFRNNVGMHYARCVHNQLQVAGTGFYSKLRFRHYGYDLDPVRMEQKHERTTSLLLKNIAEDPEDPFNHYQLAASYSMHRDYHKAIEAGEIALRLRAAKDLRNAYFSTVYYTVAQAHFALGNLAKAEDICHEAVCFFPLDLNAYHLLAAIHFKNGDLPKCRETSLRYLDILREFEEDPAEMRGVYFNSYGKQHEIYYGLAFTSFAENAFERAEEYLNRAFELEGKPKDKALEIARFYLNEKMEAKAREWAQRAGGGVVRNEEALRSSVHARKRTTASGDVQQGYEKRMMDLTTAWRLGDIDGFLVTLEAVMKALGLDTGVTLDSTVQLGRILYDVAEKFCVNEFWKSAESALSLALAISPEALPAERFHSLLSSQPRF